MFKSKIIINGNDLLYIKNKIQDELGIPNLGMLLNDNKVVFIYMGVKIELSMEDEFSDATVDKIISCLRKNLILKIRENLFTILEILKLNLESSDQEIDSIRKILDIISNTVTPLQYEFAENHFKIFLNKYNNKKIDGVLKRNILFDIEKYFNEKLTIDTLYQSKIFLYSGKETNNLIWYFTIKKIRNKFKIQDRTE